MDSLKSEKALLSAQLQKAEVHEQLFSDQLRQYVDLFHKIQEQNNFYTAMCFSDSQRLTEFQMRCGDDIRSVQENLVEARKFIQDLHNLNQEAEAENCRNKEKITRLQEALNLTSTEFGEIKNQLYSAENREVSLQKELAASRNEVEKLRHDLKSTETDNQSLLDNIRSLGDLNAKLTKGMEKLEEKMASMEKGERDLVVQLKNELKASNEKADANFRKLQSAVMSKQTEIDRLRSQLHESDQEKLANTERASEISEKLKLTLNELAAAGQQLLSQEDLIKSLKEQLDSFWNENEQLSRELKDLSCQSLLLATESQQMAMKLEEMRAAVVQMEKTDDKTITELKGQLSATIEESETKVKKAEDQVISLNDKLQEIQNKTDDYRRSHEALQLENFCLKSSIEEQTEKIKQLSEEKQQQDSEIAQLKTNLEMTSNLLVETQQKLSSEQNAADSLNKRMEFTGKEIEQLRHQLESVSNENQMVKAEKLELLENFNSLQVTVSKSEKSKKLLQAHVDDINQKLINACAELKDRIVLADLLKTQLDAAQCASQQLHKEMELAQSECFMLKASIIKLQASQQQVEAQINQKTAEILRSVESLEIAAANLAEAQRLFQSQEVYIAEMKRKSESDDKKIESLMKAVQSLELERQNLVAFGAKQAEEIQKWCKSSEHLNMALRSLQDLEQQNCGEIEKLSKERQNALDMVAQLDAKVVTLESSLESVTVQLQMTQIAEENFRLDIENARAEVAMVKELGESLQSQKDAEIRMLQERLALADAEIANGKNDRAKYEELESLLRR